MYDTILVPTDGSQGTRAAMRHAFEHARTYDAELHALYVLDIRSISGRTLAGDYVVTDWTERQQEVADEALNMVVEGAPDDVETVPVQRSGVPSREIVEYVDEADIDLVVMGTRGRTGLERYLIGSVAENVVRRSEAPVLTVRFNGDHFGEEEE